MDISTPSVIISETGEDQSQKWTFLQPTAKDGDDVFTLIANCPPLDTNSSYCNFLQTTHFSNTSVITKYDGEIAGFISGYQKPNQPNTLFIWQVAVAPQFRGKGLAYTMLEHLLNRDSLNNINAIETTITEENDASWALFKKLDARNSNNGEVSTFLDKNIHFKGKHDTELLYRIPLTQIKQKG
ncbi:MULTISPECIES: diaminobutyrate acetyltransferase [unclassified Photobacterium]|uniref:diaminobutyrate acetyltransferase n=1 Tax=unclassified Photobacterium TaxID=2628852 RepID=UPI001EDDFA39|nr:MULTISPECIES: diaminobutyrate acetyltransferase [unclassified Photobacterium]MCG3864775.1 diaminobutyrate acetyltransferase [Photobacterium sp. Ph6]MCG3876229.1 diaminobutyrate acetyltransferase [Photobacterium sp. Ph5]